MPAIILGNGLTSLGALRSFGRNGVPAYSLLANPGVMRWSRWYRGAPGLCGSISRPDELTRFLTSLPFERCVLVPCADNWVRSTARLPDELAERFPVSQASPETLDLLVDKGAFARLLERLGIPHPRTALIESLAQMESLDVPDFAGAFLKPRDSYSFFKTYEEKALRVKSRDDAVRQFERVRRDGFEVLFQEYIPGPATNHYFIDGFVDRGGNVCAMFARRRLRMYPVDFGNSTYMITVALREVSGAADILRLLLQEVNYRGIFSAEFKFDDRDGQYKILEINARPWWFVEFAAVCGVDVCMLAYRDALGQRVRKIRDYRIGATSVHPYFDVNICMRLLRSRELTVSSWVGSWLKAKYPVLCSDDPVPALAWWTMKAWHRITGQS